jgi:hypothetical protein
VPFNVSTATISTVTPASGVRGTSITIAGSGFGASQGTGQIWLGTVPGVVQTWTDTQVVVQVASGAASGNAQVLQGGVVSNAIPFTVNPSIRKPASRITATTLSNRGLTSG